MSEKTSTLKLKSITLSDRQLCDIELILDGSFAPLSGFLNKKDYVSVLNKMRLENGMMSAKMQPQVSACVIRLRSE